MKKIIRVTTEIENGKELISVVKTTKETWSASRLSAKDLERVNNFIKNAKYRKSYNVESVFEICCYSGYEYSNNAI